MSTIFAEIPVSEEEFYYGDGNELSQYEQMLEEKRQQTLLQKQIKQYGDDAMRFDPKIAIDSSTMPTEDFQRSYQMRMPGVRHAKTKEKDPLGSLLKAMKLDQNTGTKKNRGIGKENKVEDGETEGGRPAGQSPESLTLFAR